MESAPEFLIKMESAQEFFIKWKAPYVFSKNNATVNFLVVKTRLTFQHDWSLILKFAFDNFMFYGEPRNEQRMKNGVRNTRV